MLTQWAVFRDIKAYLHTDVWVAQSHEHFRKIVNQKEHLHNLDRSIQNNR